MGTTETEATTTNTVGGAEGSEVQTTVNVGASGLHTERTEVEEGSEATKATEAGTAQDESGADGRFTAAHDTALRALKSAGTPWKEISGVLGREVSELKAHWKAIKPADYPESVKSVETIKGEFS